MQERGKGRNTEREGSVGGRTLQEGKKLKPRKGETKQFWGRWEDELKKGEGKKGTKMKRGEGGKRRSELR